MKFILTLAALLIFSPLFSQDSILTKEQAYKVYSNLVGGKWESKGKWQNGDSYHQEVVVEKGLTSTIFTVKTHDHVDSKKFDQAQRNYGIRAWDEKEKKMKFWEFDVFGGIISGEVMIRGNDIYLVYQYPLKNGGTKMLADAWIHVDKDTYHFKVVEFTEGKPGKEYMTATFKRK